MTIGCVQRFDRGIALDVSDGDVGDGDAWRKEILRHSVTFP